MSKVTTGMVCVGLVIATASCSVKRVAINKLGDSPAGSGTTCAADNDPEFIGQASPFSLKLVEALLAESPRHRGLLFAAASGVTSPCADSRSGIVASPRRSSRSASGRADRSQR